MYFSCLWVTQDHDPTQHIQDFISGKDGAKLLGVTKALSRRQTKYQLVDLAARDINPIGNLPSDFVTP
jgi:hypothetical protein